MSHLPRSELFVNAAALVLKTGTHSTTAIYVRVGHGFSRAAERYRLMFEPGMPYSAPGPRGWWDEPDREAHAYALLLAHCMAADGRL